MVSVKFFAVLRKLTGREDLSLPLVQPVTLKQIFDQIEMEIPQIRTIMKEGRALVAINQEMATEDSMVQDGDEIAMLPPFAGGALVCGGPSGEETPRSSDAPTPRARAGKARPSL